MIWCKERKVINQNPAKSNSKLIKYLQFVLVEHLDGLVEDVPRDDGAGEARLEEPSEGVVDEQVEVLHAEGQLGGGAVGSLRPGAPLGQREDGIWQDELDRLQAAEIGGAHGGGGGLKLLS